MSDEQTEELLEEILENQETATGGQEKSNTTSYLVFRAGETNYAINSTEVREILRNNEVFPMPFVPPYIKGVLNSYGVPFAVVDFSLFTSDKPQDTRLFMLLKNLSNIAVQVSEIQEFHNESEVTVKNMTNAEDSPYFTGAISFDDVTAPILNINGILEKIRSDLENS
ncbi:MAG: chemotaxis protein CheW [Treponema sp.]|nr:chemotaxis protein CheW [Treponema sp.]